MLKEEFIIDKKDFWNKCIIIFDSSALLNLYEYSKEARNSIKENIFKKYSGRFWIPDRVLFEYSKNRKTALNKTINKYINLISEIENLKNQFNQINNRTKTQAGGWSPTFIVRLVSAFISFVVLSRCSLFSSCGCNSI